jgi:hypothetical protein
MAPNLPTSSISTKRQSNSHWILRRMPGCVASAKIDVSVAAVVVSAAVSNMVEAASWIASTALCLASSDGAFASNTVKASDVNEGRTPSVP